MKNANMHETFAGICENLKKEMNSKMRRKVKKNPNLHKLRKTKRLEVEEVNEYSRSSALD